MEKEDIKIIFQIDDIDLVTYTPSCIIFYTKNKVLFHLKTSVPASLLKDNNCFTVFSFLEKNYSYLITLLSENNERSSYEYVEEVLKNKDSFKSIKNKLFTILRKQKIDNLLS